METIFEAEDQNLKSGKVGFFTNGTKFVAFDKIYYEPMNCRDF